MSFASPIWLLMLLLVPLLAGLQVLSRRRRRRYAVRFPALATLAQAAAPVPAWRRRVPVGLLLAAVALLALALARPRVPYSVAVQQASMVLVSDHSGSMAATDVQPSRLAAAVQAADTFIGQLPSSVRLGAVTFSSSPDATQAPVADHSAAQSILDGQVAGGATDTGDALELALSLLHGGARGHPPAAIVLLSDGSANTGFDAVAAARHAELDRVPIYTVALGTPNGTLTNPGDPLAAPVPVPPDPQLMAQIAQISGGRTFDARSAAELISVYRTLANRLSSVTRRRDITAVLALVGGLLVLLALVTSTRWAGRLP